MCVKSRKHPTMDGVLCFSPSREENSGTSPSASYSKGPSSALLVSRASSIFHKRHVTNIRGAWVWVKG